MHAASLKFINCRINFLQVKRWAVYLGIHFIIAGLVILSLTNESAPISICAALGLMTLYTLEQPWASRLLSLTIIHSLLLFGSSFWLIISLEEMIHLHRALAMLIIASASCILSSLMSLPVILYHYWSTARKISISCALLCLIGEYLRQQTFIATPWLNYSNIAFNIPILQVALPFGGSILSSYLLLRGCETGLTICRGKIDKDGRQVFVILGLLIASSCVSYIHKWWIPESNTSNQKPLSIHLVQSNVDPIVNKDAYLNWEVHAHMLHKQPKKSLNILSEGVITFNRNELPLSKFKQYPFLKNTLIGVNYVSDNHYQSMIVGVNQVRGQYTKQHYVPFGEYLPYQRLFSKFTNFFDNKRTPVSTSIQHEIVYQNYRLFPLICYDLFFEPIYKSGLKTADAIIVIAENTWFHDTMIQSLFLRMAQVRALEYAIPVLLTMNRGHTAHISADGRIIKKLNWDTQSVLNTEILHRTSSATWMQTLDDYQILIALLLIECIGAAQILQLIRYRRSSIQEKR